MEGSQPSLDAPSLDLCVYSSSLERSSVSGSLQSLAPSGVCLWPLKVLWCYSIKPPHQTGSRSMLIPESERSPGEGHGKPIQYSCLENPIYRGAWQATVHRVAKSRTQLKQLSTQAHAGFFSSFLFCNLLLPLVSVCGTESSLVLLSQQMVTAAMKLKDACSLDEKL